MKIIKDIIQTLWAIVKIIWLMIQLNVETILLCVDVNRAARKKTKYYLLLRKGLDLASPFLFFTSYFSLNFCVSKNRKKYIHLNEGASLYIFEI